ncbi:hypothetical protein [Secundilactobacillus collinoides]|uniref:hypothetical protein n=1 Tax=Secundilactobacillus collinoides TaxID=33960 RepID=UPI0006D159D0|nr:hypothetical protein [Secundilactobacillus collinoides]
MTLLDTLQTTPGQLIPAAGDGNTFNLLTNSDTPAILLDATLATKTLLAEENPGLLTISEYAKFLRDMQLKKDHPIDCGYAIRLRQPAEHLLRGPRIRTVRWRYFNAKRPNLSSP